MRGFAFGSFALIVLYVAVQPGTAGAAAKGSNVLVAGLRRLLSPDVAGIPRQGGGNYLTDAIKAGAAAAAGNKKKP